MTTLIFANGVIDNLAWVRPYLEEASTVIAADGGLHHLMRLSVWPDVLIGDQDSLPEGFMAMEGTDQIRILAFPRDKDRTDLELALLFATENSDDEIVVLGGFGGRLDHMLANLFLPLHPQLVDKPIVYLDEGSESWIVYSYLQFNGRIGDIVSLIPLSDVVGVVETTGLRWPLHDEELVMGQTRGISNEMMAHVASIRVSDGRLLCVHLRSRED